MLVERKIGARLRELEPYRYRDVMTIDSWNFADDEAGAVGARPDRRLAGRVVHLGDEWGGRDAYAWLSQSVTVPQQWMDRTVVGRFQFGAVSGMNSQFESLLYVDDVPYQGVDGHHDEVFLPPTAPGREVSLTFRLWSGLEGGGRPRPQRYRFRQAEIAWLDEVVDDVYYTARAMLATAEALDANHAVRPALLAALDRAFRLIDWQHPGDEVFYQSLSQARNVLLADLAEIPWATPITMQAVGHTHIDVAWLWRLKHTREKAARSFSTVLRLMERFPDYIFLQSQPQLYDYLRDDYPELYEQIRQRVAEGRWEADGAMWLEADCNIPSGESLVRQILFGTRFFREQFGQTCHVLWLPDVFGYSWALPQILKKSGIDTFCTTKISWNQFNRMPHDTFLWKGMDGSEILAHFLTTPEPRDWNDSGRWFATYNGQITPGTVLGTWARYQDKAINTELLIAYGYGDGGGGVNREMLEMRRRLEDMPGLPRVETGRVDEYFARLQRTVAESEGYVHTWDGELYLEYHRGTYTSQAYQKRTNRQLELFYRESEWLNVAASLLTRSDPAPSQSALNQGWKIILRNQFHDIVPGSSIHEVYQDSHREYDEAQALATAVLSEHTAKLIANSPKDSTYTLFNSTSRARTGVVKVVDAGPNLQFRDRVGRAIPSQRVEDAYWLLSPEVPGMGWTTIAANSGESLGEYALPFTLSADGIETPHYVLAWNASGQWTRLYDKDHQREVLVPGKLGNDLQVFEDKPLNFDAWDIDIFYQEKMRTIDQLERIETISVGPVAAVLRFIWRYDQSRIEQDLTVYAQSRRIDMTTRVDWHQRQELLKVAFPVDIRTHRATYDIQFGNLERPTHWNTSWDLAKFEVVGHQWADLSESGYGVSLANDSKYGYDIRDQVLRLSLIKSAISPDYEADQGDHRFTYALIPHPGDFASGDVAALAWDLNSPLRAVAGEAERTPFRLLESDDRGIQVDAIKWAEDGSAAVVRVHEYFGGRRRVSFQSDLGIVRWQECNLMEERAGFEPSTGPMEIDFSPYEIKTFWVEFAGAKDD